MLRLATFALAIAVSAGFIPAARAQLPLPSADSSEQAAAPADSANAAPRAPSPPSAIPAASIPLRARQAEAQLEAAQGVLDGRALARIGDALPSLFDETTQLGKTSGQISDQTRRRDLIDLNLRSEVLRERVAQLEQDLTRRSDVIAQREASLESLRQTWTLTEQALAKQSDAPAVASARVSQVLSQIRASQGVLADGADKLFVLHDRLDAVHDAIEQHVARVLAVQSEQRKMFLRPDGLPAFRLFAAESYPERRLPSARPHSEYLLACLSMFWTTYHPRLFFDGVLVFLALLAALTLGRRAAARAEATGNRLGVLAMPLAGVGLILLASVPFVYTRAMCGMLDLFALASLLVIVRMTPLLVRIRRLTAPVNALLGVIALYRVLMLVHLDAPWHEAGLVGISLLLIVVAHWLRRATRSREDSQAEQEGVLPTVNRFYFCVVTYGLSLALLFGLFGFHALLTFTVDAFFGTTYWLFLCLALSRVLSTFFEALLDSERIRNLTSMRSHGALIERRVLWFARAVGVVLWVTAALYSFLLLDPLLGLLEQLLGSALHIGSWTLSLGDVVSFALSIYLATKLSRLVSFGLEQDVLPRMDLGRGVPATVSRLSGYIIVSLGFIFAVGAAGADMSRVALLASALSVGIGFGLQNVVNNFVSGLMLIFERPVRVGDTIQVGELTGEVRSIGIRASTVRTAQGAEVILPNSDLISGQVINWTLSDLSRRVEIPVGVAYGTDALRAQALMIEAVQHMEGLESAREPVCLFFGFGASSLDFELRIWVLHSDEVPNVRSRALFAILAKLSEAGIEIPFPQHDLHLRSIDARAAEALAPSGAAAAPARAHDPERGDGRAVGDPVT